MSAATRGGSERGLAPFVVRGRTEYWVTYEVAYGAACGLRLRLLCGVVRGFELRAFWGRSEAAYEAAKLAAEQPEFCDICLKIPKPLTGRFRDFVEHPDQPTARRQMRPAQMTRRHVPCTSSSTTTP